MKRSREQYVVCVKSDGAMDLEVRKIYQVLPDESAAKDGFVRIVDESGEDYLYPASFFVEIDVPEASARALRASGSRRSGLAR